jgi:hypothetical protein
VIFIDAAAEQGVKPFQNRRLSRLPWTRIKGKSNAIWPRQFKPMGMVCRHDALDRDRVVENIVRTLAALPVKGPSQSGTCTRKRAPRDFRTSSIGEQHFFEPQSLQEQPKHIVGELDPACLRP